MLTRRPTLLYRSAGQGVDQKTWPRSYGSQTFPADRKSRLSSQWVYEVAANKPFEILLTVVSVVEWKLLKGLVICYAIRILVVNLAVAGTMAAVVCEFLSLGVDQATAATI